MQRDLLRCDWHMSSLYRTLEAWYMHIGVCFGHIRDGLLPSSSFHTVCCLEPRLPWWNLVTVVPARVKAGAGVGGIWMGWKRLAGRKRNVHVSCRYEACQSVSAAANTGRCVHRRGQNVDKNAGWVVAGVGVRE